MIKKKYNIQLKLWEIGYYIKSTFKIIGYSKI